MIAALILAAVTAPEVVIPPQYGIPFLSAVLLALLGYVIQRALKNRPAPPDYPGMWKRLDEQQLQIDALRDRLEASEGREASAVREARDVKSIVRDWFGQLSRWDTSGRAGAMPLPSPENMKRLGVNVVERGGERK